MNQTNAHGKIGAFFTPSNTAKQNYLYLQFAGESDGGAAEGRGIDSFLLLYTHAGKGELEYLDRHYAVGAGEGFIIHCKQPYAYRPAPGADWKYDYFNINGQSFPVYYNQLLSARRLVFRAEAGTKLREWIGDLQMSARMPPGPKSELVASKTILCILTELIVADDTRLAEQGVMPKYVEGIMAHINRNYAAPITLDALAERFNVSKYHLSREFKKYTGYSPNEYVISVRINRAKALLKHTGDTVGEIAVRTGYGDVNHFIQLFKSREGLTPAAFRKRWTGEDA
ncbi:MAG: helix-turn-helix domain-containing protein [Christensenellales bacterium]